MLILDDIKVEFESQGFKGTHLGISPEKDKTVLFMESVRPTKSVRCPFCGGSVYPAPKAAAARGLNRTSAAHLTAHGLPDIISTAHIV